VERAEENVVTGFRNTIVDSIEDISRAVSAEAVWEAVKAFARPNGFDYMLVLKTKESSLEAISGSVLYTDMPAGFAEAFDAAGFSRDNPLVSHAFVEPRPYTAAELWGMDLTVRQRRALAQLNLSLEVLDGLIIPIRIADKLEGIVMLGGRNPKMEPVVRSSLHLFAQCAVEHVLEFELKPRRREGGLSPREVECLRWAAAGKTDAEIGRILTISPRTTRFHIENAKKKLGVATRIQAVTEALRLRAIAA
jgi:DNA-binding CsgD family transcriptional regulator